MPERGSSRLSRGLFVILVGLFKKAIRPNFTWFLQRNVPFRLCADSLWCELFIEEEPDVVLASLPGILEIHDPMRPQELVVVKRFYFFSPELVVDLFPRIVDAHSQTFARCFVQFLVRVERSEVDQPILEQFE